MTSQARRKQKHADLLCGHTFEEHGITEEMWATAFEVEHSALCSALARHTSPDQHQQPTDATRTTGTPAVATTSTSTAGPDEQRLDVFMDTVRAVPPSPVSIVAGSAALASGASALIPGLYQSSVCPRHDEVVASLLPGVSRWNPLYIGALAAIAAIDKISTAIVNDIEEKNKEVWARVPQLKISLADYSTPEALAQKLNAVAPQLTQHGTIFLVAGASWASFILRAVTNGRFSHVALIHPTSDLGPMCFQATQPHPSKANFPFSASFRPGTKTNDGTSMHDLARYIIDYAQQSPGSRFVIRAMRTPLGKRQTKKLLKYYVKAVKKAERYPELNKLALAWACQQSPFIKKTIVGLFGSNAIDYSGKVCSELVACALSEAGILNLLGKPVERWYPHDFALDFGSNDPMRVGSTPPEPMLGSETEIIVEVTKPSK